jgi:hypothetical protein
MEKEITLSNGLVVTVKEMKYVDAVDMDINNSRKDNAIKMFKASTNLTDEQILNLSIKDGQILESTITEVNGLKVKVEDFINPVEKKE